MVQQPLNANQISEDKPVNIREMDFAFLTGGDPHVEPHDQLNSMMQNLSKEEQQELVELTPHVERFFILTYKAETGEYPPEPNTDAINKTVDIINSCTSPIILVGDRMAQSSNTNSLENLAELIGAKVYSTSYSEMNFPTTHPQYCGPLTPNPLTKKELSKSDLIIGVGTNLFSSFFYFSGRLARLL